MKQRDEMYYSAIYQYVIYESLLIYVCKMRVIKHSHHRVDWIDTCVVTCNGLARVRQTSQAEGTGLHRTALTHLRH